jgi:hypothetical protein
MGVPLVLAVVCYSLPKSLIKNLRKDKITVYKKVEYYVVSVIVVLILSGLFVYSIHQYQKEYFIAYFVLFIFPSFLSLEIGFSNKRNGN